MAKSFRHPKIDDFRNRLSVLQAHQHVRRFEVAVDDALLMCMLDRMTDFDKQVQSLPGCEAMLVAVISQRNPLN